MTVRTTFLVGGFHLCPDTLSFFVKSVKTGRFLPSECSETVSLDWRISLLVYLRARERISHIHNVFIHKYYAKYHQKDRENHVFLLSPTVYGTLRPKKMFITVTPSLGLSVHTLWENAQKKNLRLNTSNISFWIFITGNSNEGKLRFFS